jgi:hypothetical protein
MGVVNLWGYIAAPSREKEGQTSVSRSTPVNFIRDSQSKATKVGYLELAGRLPKRGVILVELHCIGEDKLNILSKLRNAEIFLPLEMFLKRVHQEPSITAVTKRT